MAHHHDGPIPQEPWRPGSWVHARLARLDTTLLTLLLAGLAANRAWDYATPPPWAHGPGPRPSPGLSVVESAAPMWVWVGWLLAAAGILAVSALTRIHVGVWAGHSLLFIAYLALAVGFTVEYGLQPWADGLRSAGPMWLITSLHIILAIPTGWRPPQWHPST